MEIFKMREQFDKIRKGSILKEYLYDYFLEDSNGNLIKDSERFGKYGSTRGGYEKLKQREPSFVEHSGVVSLRAMTKFIDGKNTNIGWIKETKLETKNEDYEKELATLFDSVYELFVKTFNLDNPIKVDLVLKLMHIDEFSTVHSIKDKLNWMFEKLEQRENYSDDELEDITRLILSIGELTL